MVEVKREVKTGSQLTDDLNDRLTLQELHENNQHQDLEIIKKTLGEMAGKISENTNMVGELTQISLDKAKLWKEVKVLQGEAKTFRTEKAKLEKEINELKMSNLELKESLKRYIHDEKLFK